MLEVLNNLDKNVFLAINGLHNGFLDFVMYWLSDKLIWIPLYLYFLWLIYRQYKKKVLWILLFALVMILVSDQSSVHFFKNVFHRLRPCHDPALQGMVHLVKSKCGGDYSFISSHACNSFAIAVFMIQVIGRKYRYFSGFVLIWAAMICYSRVYLGVHFPGDVIVGAAWGALLGWAFGYRARQVAAI
jgi:undecaprenyl-diphosphatase